MIIHDIEAKSQQKSLKILFLYFANIYFPTKLVHLWDYKSKEN